jgi:hypothetical protein
MPTGTWCAITSFQPEHAMPAIKELPDDPDRLVDVDRATELIVLEDDILAFATIRIERGDESLALHVTAVLLAHEVRDFHECCADRNTRAGGPPETTAYHVGCHADQLGLHHLDVLHRTLELGGHF